MQPPKTERVDEPSEDSKAEAWKTCGAGKQNYKRFSAA
jgi:hypothetical protein